MTLFEAVVQGVITGSIIKLVDSHVIKRVSRYWKKHKGNQKIKSAIELMKE